MKTPLLFHGMHGIGDCIHQRAVVRELKKAHEVWIRTSFPQVYHDFADVHLLALKSPIRVMAKNEVRAAHLYGTSQPPAGTLTMGCSYPPQDVIRTGSVLGAMSKRCGVPVGDFRLAIPQEWLAKAGSLIPSGRPVLVYRPLVERIESAGYAVRNPDHAAYSALVCGIRKRFYVISLADLEPGKEWAVGPQIQADAEYHAGELDFETIAGLFKLAALVFSAPGFATVLAQAVGTPAVCVFGGFEDARSFSAGARFSPWLAVEPITPCACWSHGCKHSKEIDLPAAAQRIGRFLTETECVPC